jgi:hypothetical protein
MAGIPAADLPIRITKSASRRGDWVLLLSTRKKVKEILSTVTHKQPKRV